MERLKNLLFGLGFLFFISFFFETGSTSPPKNSLVYIDASSYLFYPPHKVPEKRTLLPMSYKMAKDSGARPYRIDGFYVDGPAIIVVMLQKIGIWPWEHLTWGDNGGDIEYFLAKRSNSDDFSHLEKAIYPANYELKNGDLDFPEHENISHEVANNLCFIHALEHLKYRYPNIPVSEIVKSSQENEISHLRVVSDLCMSQQFLGMFQQKPAG